MILIPFSFVAVSGLPPVNTTPSLIETIGPITLEYTPGVWENATTIGYVWYSDGVAEDETAGTFTTLPGVEVTLIETATNVYGEIQQVSNSITIPGEALDQIEETAGVVVTHSGAYSPSNEYAFMMPQTAGLVVTNRGSCTDSVDCQQSAGLVVTNRGVYADQVFPTAENGYYSHYQTGVMGDAITVSPTSENGYYSHYFTGTLP
jgi:hypothetical protein